MSVHTICLQRTPGEADCVISVVDAIDATRHLVTLMRLAGLQIHPRQPAAASIDTGLDLVEHSLEDIAERLQALVKKGLQS